MKRSLKEKKYIINYYSALKLLENGYLEDGFLVCDKEVSYYGLIDSFQHADCQLFDQTIKALGQGANINEIFIILDFSEVDRVSDFLPFKNGIKLYINGRSIIFQDYLKSNSMNKNFRIYYINSEYYPAIHERISFGFDDAKNVPMSKWYAYSGLSLSDATILNDINIGRDELCVIPDKIIKKEINCITAISIPVLVDKLYEYQDQIEKHINSRRYILRRDQLYYDEILRLKDCPDLVSYLSELDDEINCYRNSKDFEKLPIDIQELLNAIVDLKECNMDEILDYVDDLIFDYEQSLNPNSIEWHKIYVEHFKVKINCFDGEGLISKDFAADINTSMQEEDIYQDEDEEERESKSDDINSFQIRLPFLKGVIHSTDILAFCKKHNISEIEGLYSFKNRKLKKYKVEKIKLVITESQFKAASFMKYLNLTMDDYFDYLEKYDYHIAVSGVEPKEKSEVRLCYQFLSTLPIKPNELDYLIDENMLSLYQEIEEENVIKGLELANSYSYPTGLDIYKINPLFYKSTELYINKRRDLFEFEKNNLALGKLKIKGTRKYLASDLLALLYHMIGKKTPRNTSLKNNEFYSPNTPLSKECIVLRNPHYSRNEIVIMQNSMNSNLERDEFFSHLTGIFMVNPQSLIADRLGGADYDGDEVCILNDEKLFQIVCSRLIGKNKEYIYPLVKIPSITNHQTRKDEPLYNQRIRSLESTFSNETGKISNMAFEKTLKAYWSDDEDLDEIENVSFFTVLGGLEIDSCKNGKKPTLPKRGKDTIDYLKIKDTFLKKNKNNYKTGDIKTYIKNVNDHCEENTLYYVFSSFMKEKVPQISSTYDMSNIPSCEVDDDLIKTAAIVETYYYLFNVINNEVFADNNLTKTIESSILYELNKIFKDNNYNIDIKRLILKFNFNAINNFNKYLDKNITPFHFLTDNIDKEDFIKNYLQIKNLTENEIMALSNFNNSGYKSLYLILYYNYLLDFRSRLLSLIGSYNNEKLHYINKNISQRIGDLDSVTEKVELYLEEVSSQVSNVVRKDQMIVMIINYLTQKATNIKSSAILNVIKPLESRMIFSVFKKQIKDYLKREENVNE